MALFGIPAAITAVGDAVKSVSDRVGDWFKRKERADNEEAGVAKYRAQEAEAKEKGLTDVIKQQAAPAPTDDEAVELARRRDAERLR